MGYAFHEYDDDCRVLKRVGVLDRSLETIRYYQNLATPNRKSESAYMNLRPEMREIFDQRVKMHLDWYTCGKPYLKVFPGIATYLAKINIAIPCERVQMPFPAFEIRLSKTDNIFTETADDSHAVRSIMVSTRPDGRLHIFIDIGLRDEVGITTHLEQYMTLEPGRTVSEVLDEFYQERILTDRRKQLIASICGVNVTEQYQPSQAFNSSIFALVLSSIFFLTGRHKEVAPDIPNRLVHRFHQAKEKGDADAVAAILKQAREVGHTGYTAGKETELPREIIVRHYEARKSGKTWEHSHGHWRSAMFRNQPHGPRDNPSYEQIFILPCRVRPDLPLANDERGYRIPDDVVPLHLK